MEWAEALGQNAYDVLVLYVFLSLCCDRRGSSTREQEPGKTGLVWPYSPGNSALFNFGEAVRSIQLDVVF